MKKNYVFPISTILFSAFFLIVSLLNPTSSSTHIGPNVWPNIVLTFTLMLGVLQLIKTINEYRKNDRNTEQDSNKEGSKKNEDIFFRNKHWIILGTLALYIFLLPYTGFLISTIILVCFFFWLFGMRKKLGIILLSLASDAFFIVLFAHILNITLPRGIGIFETLSFIFY